MVQYEKWKMVLVALICVGGLLFALPNLFSKTTLTAWPDWLPHKQVNLGLDLQGGSHLLLEVDVDAVVRENLDNLEGAVRADLRDGRIRYRALGVQDGAVTVTIPQDAQRAEARTRLRRLDDAVTVSEEADGTFVLQYTEQALREETSQAVQQSIEIIRRRIDELGTNEPLIQRQGERRILVQLPGVDKPERIKSLLGQTAKLTLHLVDENVSPSELASGRVPPGVRRLPHADSPEGQPRYVAVKKRVVVGGGNLKNAQPTLDQRSGQWVVAFSLDTRGARLFGEATQKNVGRQLAIVLDGEVVSAPVIRTAILGGSGQIEGGFTVESAKDLSLLLRAGALPAPLTILEERTVGPGLGADSIAAGKVASLIGLAAVVVFMALAYGLFGLFANAALLINMMLILGVLSALQATLTLPGIAGIVLTIGMAVDANVLVFERMREEQRNGRAPVTAVDAGYRQALSTIVDANITTLIAAVLLFAFGSGPVRGFAVTLSIGIVTSMFTAIMVTRLFVVLWLRRGSTRPQALPI